MLKLADVPTPIPGRDEALVKVHAVGLNGYDLMARAGRYKPNKGKFPHILGGDFGGEVVALWSRYTDRTINWNTSNQLVGSCAMRALRSVHWKDSQIAAREIIVTSVLIFRVRTPSMSNYLRTT